MSPEMYTIVAVAIALAGLIMNGQRAMNVSLADLRRKLNELRNEFHRDITNLNGRVARLEGLVEGLRDSIAGKAA